VMLAAAKKVGISPEQVFAFAGEYAKNFL
jgi:hypothetical protein